MNKDEDKEVLIKVMVLQQVKRTGEPPRGWALYSSTRASEQYVVLCRKTDKLPPYWTGQESRSVTHNPSEQVTTAVPQSSADTKDTASICATVGAGWRTPNCPVAFDVCVRRALWFSWIRKHPITGKATFPRWISGALQSSSGTSSHWVLKTSKDGVSTASVGPWKSSAGKGWQFTLCLS